jgi:hypothetical protein
MDEPTAIAAPQITPPVILIAGPAGHGKTTAREILVKLTGLRGGSCSDVVYHYLALLKGVPVSELFKQDKETLRPELVKTGNWLCGDIGNLQEALGDAPCSDDVYRVPSTLVRTLYHNRRNIIDGVRRRQELLHAIEHLEWNGIRVLSIFVSNPTGPKIEDNTENLSSLCDELVSNDGTVEQLETKLSEILCRRFPA